MFWLYLYIYTTQNVIFLFSVLGQLKIYYNARYSLETWSVEQNKIFQLKPTYNDCLRGLTKDKACC